MRMPSWFRVYVRCVVATASKVSKQLFVVLTASVLLTGCSARTATGSVNAFSKDDYATLAMLRAEGKTQATIIAIAEAQNTQIAAAELSRRGCETGFAAEEVGYVRCIIELARVAELLNTPGVDQIAVSATQLSSVQAIDKDDSESIASRRNARPTPSSKMPADNPFTASSAMQALEFKKRYPSYDGRGVIVGVVEPGVDVLTPELSHGLNVKGRPRRKLVDFTLTGNWVLPDAAISGWMYGGGAKRGAELARISLPRYVVKTDAVQPNESGEVVYQENVFRLPKDWQLGEWRMGVFDVVNDKNSVRAFDTNLDQNFDQLDDYFLLYNSTEKVVWVDVDHNRDFGNDKSLRDYSVAQEFDVFGQDDPKTVKRELRPFFAHLDQKHAKHVWLEAANSGHGVMVASVMAGDDFLASNADGIAPKASIVLHKMVEGFTHTYIEILIEAFRDKRTDLITFSAGDNVSRTDGRYVIDVVASRLVEYYKKPIFAAAGNTSQGIGQLTSPSTAPNVISVGAFTPRETWRANFGVTPTSIETLAPYSAVGPAENGALQPDLLGVTGTLSATAGFIDVPGVAYDPPAGYALSSGTSASTPTAAGAAALLISAAKQENIPYDAQRLRTAMISTAKFLPGVEARKQGNGLVQVNHAWEALRLLAGSNYRPVEIVSEASVRTATSHLLKTPHRGVGLFEVGGWRIGGAPEQRELIFTRKSGPAEPIEYKVRWKGGTDVFESEDTIMLPLNMPVKLMVTIAPRKFGSASAIIDLIDPATGLIAYQTLNTIIVPHTVALNPEGGVEISGVIHRPGMHDLFFDIPSGVDILKISSSIVNGNAQPKLNIFNPYGKYIFLRSGGVVDTFFKDGEANIVIVDPKPGVWHVVIDNGTADTFVALDENSAHPVKRAEFRITASAASANLLAQQAMGDRESRSVSFEAFGSESSSMKLMSLGLASVNTEIISSVNEDGPILREIDVPAGASRLEVTLDKSSDPDVDIDLFLFKAGNKLPYLAGESVSNDSEEKIEVINPKKGKWIAMMWRYGPAAASAEFRYSDSFYHESFGELTVEATSDSDALANSIKVTPTVKNWASNGRRLVGAVGLFHDDASISEYRDNGVGELTPLPISTAVFPIEK